MRFAAHRIVSDIHQIQNNAIVTLAANGEWVVCSHSIQAEEIAQTSFYSGILFPTFPLLEEMADELGILSLAQIYSASFCATLTHAPLNIQNVLNTMCYIPWQMALQRALDLPKGIALLEHVDLIHETTTKYTQVSKII